MIRLIKDEGQGNLRLVEYDQNETPPYAILSHTWGANDEEVTYKDFIKDKNKEKAGWKKIEFCRERAVVDHMQHFWIDTCCIDKTNSVELNEAINSMFHWYHCSAKCYVYLSDVSRIEHRIVRPVTENTWEDIFRESRWFRRGWTLQELIAPKSVEFFSKEGDCLGSKWTLEDQIHDITGIAIDVLRGRSLTDFSVEQRFNWARLRETKRQEDQAYSLLGLFNIHMTPIYGEGKEKALRRLQEKIRKSSNAIEEYPKTSKLPLPTAPFRHDAGFVNQKSLLVRETLPLLELEDESKPNKDQRNNFMAALWFQAVDARYLTIKAAHAKTCKWLLQKPEYKDWLDTGKVLSHHGLLWIKGKPGSGKSILMKFLVANTRKRKVADIVIYFFFNARGEDLEKSTFGMYRSLLYQLLKALPDLQTVLTAHGMGFAPDGTFAALEEAHLKELLATVIQHLRYRYLICFIDALDECQENEIRDLINFLQNLGQLAVSSQIHLNVCLSSRHYPHISITKGIQLVLEGQEGHVQDIAQYLNSELRSSESKKSDTIKEEILTRASGIFLWVALVVQILNKEIDHGRVYTLSRRLKEIPDGLDRLFEDILTRDQDNLNELVLCLQWILYTKRPLRREELYYAILSGIDDKMLCTSHSNEVTTQVMDKFILSCSKGLAEITKVKVQTVQFIHESVRDFLLGANGLSKLKIYLDLGQSYENMKRCCFRYMNVQIFSHLPSGKDLPQAKSTEAKKLRESLSEESPFLEYAVHNMLFHADLADGQGISQTAFVESLILNHWILLDNIFQPHEVRRHISNASLLYILAEKNLSNLIQTELKRETDPDNAALGFENERYGTPLHAAMASAEISENTIRALLFPSIQAPFNDCHERNIRQQKSIDLCKGIYPLIRVASEGYEAILQMLLEKGAKVNAQGRYYSNALQAASAGGYEKVVQILLEKGADPNAQGGYYSNALQAASVRYYIKVVQILLEKGADSNAEDGYYSSALQTASARGYKKVVQILLKKGADPYTQGGYFGSALQAALNRGYKKVVQTLGRWPLA